MGKFKFDKLTKQDHVKPFKLEGQFLGFEVEGYKIKRLWMTTPAGDCCIKLTKEARASCDRTLHPGDWLAVWGEQKLDPETQETRLKAYRILNYKDSCPEQARLPDQVEARVREGDGDFVNLGQVVLPSTAQPQVSTRNTPQKAMVLVCHKSDCAKRGGSQICQALEATLADRGLADQIVVKKTGCMKRCKAGPNLVIMPDKTRYSQIDLQTIPDLVDQHFSSARN